jgi:hypothetical protein
MGKDSSLRGVTANFKGRGLAQSPAQATWLSAPVPGIKLIIIKPIQAIALTVDGGHRPHTPLKASNSAINNQHMSQNRVWATAQMLGNAGGQAASLAVRTTIIAQGL